MKMTPRERTILSVLFVIICIGLFYNFDYRPSMERIEDGKVVLGRLENDYDRLLRWEAEVPETEARLAEVQEELDGWVAEARAVSDGPLALLFWELHGAEDRVEFNLIRLSGTQATVTFRAPDYESVRTFLRRMEEKVAFEVLKARFSVPGEGAVDGAFDIKLSVGPAAADDEWEAGSRLNPFVR